MIVFLDGKYVLEEEAKISIFDRGFLFGDGLYATIQVKEGEPLFLNTHLERLEFQAKKLGINMPTLKKEWVYETIEKNRATTGIYKLKIVITGGEDPEMRLPGNRFGHCIVFLKPFVVPPYATLTLASYPYPIQTPHSTFKSLAHLNRYYVMEYGKQQGCDDAVTLSTEGYLLEAAFGNLFWIFENSLFTPDRDLSYHFGVTVSEIIQMMSELGFSPHFVKMRLDEVPEKAIFFRCNTMSGIRPISRVDKKQFPRDLHLEKLLLETFEKKTRLVNFCYCRA